MLFYSNSDIIKISCKSFGLSVTLRICLRYEVRVPSTRTLVWTRSVCMPVASRPNPARHTEIRSPIPSNGSVIVVCRGREIRGYNSPDQFPVIDLEGWVYVGNIQGIYGEAGVGGSNLRNNLSLFFSRSLSSSLFLSLPIAYQAWRPRV